MSGSWEWADEPVDGDVLGLLTASAASDLVAMGLDRDTAAAMAPMQAGARLHGHRAQHPDAVAYVVVAPDRAVLGRVMVDRSTAPWSVVDLVVHPSARRAGVATALLSRVTEEADAAGVAVVLQVRPDNTPALTLYAAAGFADIASDGPDRVLRRPPAAPMGRSDSDPRRSAEPGV